MPALAIFVIAYELQRTAANEHWWVAFGILVGMIVIASIIKAYPEKK